MAFTTTTVYSAYSIPTNNAPTYTFTTITPGYNTVVSSPITATQVQYTSQYGYGLNPQLINLSSDSYENIVLQLNVTNGSAVGTPGQKIEVAYAFSEDSTITPSSAPTELPSWQTFAGTINTTANAVTEIVGPNLTVESNYLYVWINVRSNYISPSLSATLIYIGNTN